MRRHRGRHLSIVRKEGRITVAKILFISRTRLRSGRCLKEVRLAPLNNDRIFYLVSIVGSLEECTFEDVFWLEGSFGVCVCFGTMRQNDRWTLREGLHLFRIFSNYKLGLMTRCVTKGHISADRLDRGSSGSDIDRLAIHHSVGHLTDHSLSMEHFLLRNFVKSATTLLSNVYRFVRRLTGLALHRLVLLGALQSQLEGLSTRISATSFCGRHATLCLTG